MSYDLGDYVEVKDRLATFKKDWPDGRLESEVVTTGFAGFVAVKAYAYRTPNDTTPGTGLAWEPVPGLTPYTKNSELQNAETSAWGRALIAAQIADASAGIASADEVRNSVGRQSEAPRSEGIEQSSPTVGAQCPVCASEVYDNRAEILGTDSRKPLWRCKNKECQGELKKDGNGWWPVSSWDDDPFGPAPVREDFPPPELVVVPDAEPFENGDPDEAPF